MKNLVLNLLAAGLIMLSTSAGTENNDQELKKVNADLSGSKINWTGIKQGGQHKGYIKLMQGNLILEENQLKGGSLLIDLNTLTDTDLQDQSVNRKLVNHLKSPEIFDVEKYPTARFEITDISKLPVTRENQQEIKATHRIEGNLTMKGMVQKISFDASVSVLKGRIAVSSQPFAINRSKPDELTLQVELLSK